MGDQSRCSEEAIRALRRARLRYPSLGPNGFDDPTAKVEHEEVATALAFLNECKPNKHSNMNSYGLKHAAEFWAKKEFGRYCYVSPGAMLVALIWRGFRVERQGRNAMTGVAIRSLRRATAGTGLTV